MRRGYPRKVFRQPFSAEDVFRAAWSATSAGPTRPRAIPRCRPTSIVLGATPLSTKQMPATCCGACRVEGVLALGGRQPGEGWLIRGERPPRKRAAPSSVDGPAAVGGPYDRTSRSALPRAAAIDSLNGLRKVLRVCSAWKPAIRVFGGKLRAPCAPGGERNEFRSPVVVAASCVRRVIACECRFCAAIPRSSG